MFVVFLFPILGKWLQNGAVSFLYLVVFLFQISSRLPEYLLNIHPINRYRPVKGKDF